MTRTKNDSAGLGAHGERIAAQYLTRAGMQVLDRNWRCPAGEIDLVLREEHALVICEVKTRRDVRFGHPLEAVDADKVARLHLLAALWQEECGVRPEHVRLDAVSVLVSWSGEAQIEHVRGIG